MNKLYTGFRYATCTLGYIEGIANRIDWTSRKLLAEDFGEDSSLYLNVADAADIELQVGDLIWVNRWNRIEACKLPGIPPVIVTET